MFWRAIAAAAATFEKMHGPPEPAHVVGKRLDPSPLLVAKPEQIVAPDPSPVPKRRIGSDRQSARAIEF
jgi:hypothetical protein